MNVIVPNGAKIESNLGQISTIVRTLACVVIICVFGIFTLLYFSRTIPTELWLLTSNCFTALSTMLVKTTPTQSTASAPETPAPVTP